MTIPVPDNNRYAATIGFFDGVHLGHVHLLKALLAAANERGLKSMAITFPEHPRQILQSDYRPRLLSTPDDKMRMLVQTGIDYCFPLHFTTALAAMDAESFMTDFLQKKLGVSTLLVGHDHHFGHDTSLTTDDYRHIGLKIGMDIIPADAYLYEGSPVSSSRIRRELVAGNVKAANDMLGYRYTISGTVIHGLQNGRKMGFPTANLGPYCEFMQIPADGVYSALATVDGETWPAMLNIGFRPTFQGTARTIEAHLLGFDRDIYFRELKLEFVDFLRPEKRFSSPQLLAAQLEADRNQVKQTIKTR
ncbi:MAG: bifunctional riboflavin kinase/FAD synthetase [Bacteroidaceae bacterium]|nr:bifunctional riboflavin kinase/FAD synthetase [Bacteroidaceae bacterium]